MGSYRDKKLSPSIDEDMQMSQSLAFIEQAHDSQCQFFSEQEIQAFFAQDNAYDRQAMPIPRVVSLKISKSFC
ncbi:lipase secretion chaperone [Shewanella benthica]|uniref:Lipase chaperone n=1 Tax=Shewanella benthica KT99 TaxID=314608 RepID=A9DFK2_9GAMM|nr:lipase secretion chaperone [Shewanella benthica]EDP99922.1 hypothetical protein KT99_05612 [Shewanella benthica KT99]